MGVALQSAAVVGIALASAGCLVGLLWVQRHGLLLVQRQGLLLVQRKGLLPLATQDPDDLNLKGRVGVLGRGLQRQGLLLDATRHPVRSPRWLQWTPDQAPKKSGPSGSELVRTPAGQQLLQSSSPRVLPAMLA